MASTLRPCWALGIFCRSQVSFVAFPSLSTHSYAGGKEYVDGWLQLLARTRAIVDKKSITLANYGELYVCTEMAFQAHRHQARRSSRQGPESAGFRRACGARWFDLRRYLVADRARWLRAADLTASIRCSGVLHDNPSGARHASENSATAPAGTPDSGDRDCEDAKRNAGSGPGTPSAMEDVG